LKKKQRRVLVGGFNPFEKYKSNWIISPGRDENKKYLSCHHLEEEFIQGLNADKHLGERPKNKLS